MVRAYKVKGWKRKKGEEFEQFEKKKAKKEDDECDYTPRIPIDEIANCNKKQPGVIFIIEKASLEIGKLGKAGKKDELWRSEKHANILEKNKLNPDDYRPDIAHEAIKAVLDSIVNKSGRLKALYVKTQKGLLIDIKPHANIPRTYDRFAGLMVQLLKEKCIKAKGTGEEILSLIEGPVTHYIPINSHKIGFSYSSEKMVNINDYVDAIDNELDLVFVVGAMAHGKIDKEEVEDYISISEFPMSSVSCISKITNAVELKWGIL